VTVIVKTIKPDPMRRTSAGAMQQVQAVVDFDEEDAMEWAILAVKNNSWHTVCEQARPIANIASSYDVETVAAIAAPDGRIAVWYGWAKLVQPTRQLGRSYVRRPPTTYEAAYSALNCRAAARLWDARVTRQGDRDVTALALAACRCLHAQAFGYAPSARDQLLAEFASLVGRHRPKTSHILKASATALEAASALLAINNYQAAKALLAGKGIG